MIKQLLQQVGWKSLTELLSRAISLVFIFYTARTLGDTGYGSFSLPLAWSGLWLLTLDWGTHYLLIREVGEGQPLDKLLPPAVLLKLLACVFFIFGMYVTSFLTPQIPLYALAAAGLWSMAQSWNDGLFALLNAYERFRAEAVYRNVMRAALLIPQLGVLFFAPNVWRLLWVSALTQVGLTFLLAVHMLWPYRQSILFTLTSSIKTLWQDVYTLWKKGLSFWLTNIAWLIYLKLDLVMLPLRLKEAPLQTLGWYQGALRFYEIVALTGYILGMILYPRWVRWGRSERNKIWRQLNSLLWPVAAALAAVVYLSAPIFIPLLLGKAFIPSVALFQVLCFSLPAVIFNQVALGYFSAQHRQHQAAFLTGLCLLINGVLNFMGIPYYGAFAAAWSTVIADAVLALGFILLSFQPSPRKSVAR